MQGKNFRILLYCLIFLWNRQNISAQDAKLPPLNFTVNISAGLPNLIGQSIAAQGTGSNGGASNTINLEVGYEISKRVLLSFYFSEAIASTGNFSWTDTANVVHTNYTTASITCLGLSGKYYIYNGLHFKPYVGCMVGYCFINLNENGDYEVPSTSGPNINLGQFAYHAYIGSFYFHNWWGLDARIGYGNNYYASVGLAFKFKVNREEY
jgi:hypothetical protein